MFSVVIPLYNKAAYIGKAIKSVLGQEFSAFELIIVDDGSTDGSAEVAGQFIDQRIHIIRQDNAGVSTARNNGVKAAKHEYIAFLDADDWWDPHYLEGMQELIRTFSDAGLWAAKYFKVKHGRKIEARIGLDKGFTAGYIDYFRVYARTMWMPITSSSFIVRKEVFENAGGYKITLKIGEDFDLWGRIAIKHKIAYLNKALSFYNQDVGIGERTLGWNKIWHPENHYIFQIDYLLNQEKNNPAMKQLLDKLRAYTLLRYYLSREFQNETNAVLHKINPQNIPFKYRLFYNLPPGLVKLYYSMKRSVIKMIKTVMK